MWFVCRQPAIGRMNKRTNTTLCGPTDHELETCRRIVLTCDQPWNPNDLSFTEQEEAVASHVSAVHQNGDSRIEILPMPAELCDDADSALRLISQVRIASDDFEGDGLSGYKCILLKIVHCHSSLTIQRHTIPIIGLRENGSFNQGV